MKWLHTATVVALSFFGNSGNAIPLDVEDANSVREAAATIAYGLMRYYTGNNTGDTPGFLPDPYYWWEAGAMFGTMVDYYRITGDDSYVDPTRQALMHQMGENRDYNPFNVSMQMGNDDQGFWGMSAMLAAENMFPDPPEGETQYVPAVQAVFNEYAMRWDQENNLCDGGLRWQVYSTNIGWDYKNTISNGCFFNIAARLGRYTGNQTYFEWAERVWDWAEGRNLITDDWDVQDGTHINNETNRCDSTVPIQWTYNSGIMLYGAAVMYNATREDVWRTRVEGLLGNIQQVFVQDDVLFEQFCEPHGTCNQDQQSFKGYLARWLAWTTRMIPDLFDTIHPLLINNAEAAAAICTGTTGEFRGHQGTACGFRWSPPGVNDELYGVGEQMNALAAVMTVLIDQAEPPATLSSGGTSIDDPSGGVGLMDPNRREPITTADRVGAGFVTVIFCGIAVGYTSFMVL